MSDLTTGEADGSRGRARAKNDFHQARIDALARRAIHVDGSLRRLLEARLDQLEDAPRLPAGHVPRALPTAGPIAGVVEQLARHGTAETSRSALNDVLRLCTAARTGSQRRQALQPAPADAGPLNSTSLVHRALAQMHAASPAYLEAFLAHVEAVAWLQGAAPAPLLGKNARSGSSREKGPRGRARSGSRV